MFQPSLAERQTWLQKTLFSYESAMGTFQTFFFWKSDIQNFKFQSTPSHNAMVGAKSATVLSVGCAVKTDVSSVPEERTEIIDQPTNQQPALTGLAGQRANQFTSAAFTLAPIPKQTIESQFILLFLFFFCLF